MSSSSARSRKEHLFSYYASNLSAIVPQYQDQFLCPLCLQIFGRESIATGDLTEEHIVPRSLGGGLVTLTCQQCNTNAGSSLESHLVRRFEYEDFVAGTSCRPQRARVPVGSGEMGADIYRYADRIEIHGLPSNSHPELHAAAVRALERGVMPRSVTLTQTYKGLPSWVAVLRMGYLLMFHHFGYRYILHNNVSRVRKQILSPKEQRVTSRAVVRLDQAPAVPYGVGVLYAPKELRCFAATFNLTTGLDRHLAVVLPGLDADSEQIYDRWEELAGPIRNVRFAIAMMPLDPRFVCDPNNAQFVAWMWSNVAKPLCTWAQRSEFCYHGSVATDTEIWYGRKPSRATVTAAQYGSLLKHFKHQTVDIGAWGGAPPGSVGAWLHEHVTKTPIASYVGAILVHEDYAERVPEDRAGIRFVKDSP
jgi:hypothetical protein